LNETGSEEKLKKTEEEVNIPRDHFACRPCYLMHERMPLFASV